MSNRGFVATCLALSTALGLQACVDRNVVAVQVGLVEVNPPDIPLTEDETLQFRATVEDVNGRALPRATVTWESETPDLVSITDDGFVTALERGDAKIRACFRDVCSTATITVRPAPEIVLSQDSAVFRGAVGAQSPPAVVVQITNGGACCLTGLTTEVQFGDGQPGGWFATKEKAGGQQVL